MHQDDDAIASSTGDHLEEDTVPLRGILQSLQRVIRELGVSKHPGGHYQNGTISRVVELAVRFTQPLPNCLGRIFT